jgi:ABC-type Zn2+ transport system substrate-binding protein/surface adhesin
MASAPHQHSHDHTHGHDHGHPHHGHTGPLELVARAPAASVAASLLRLSAGFRAALAGGLIAAIWLGVFWAVR